MCTTLHLGLPDAPLGSPLLMCSSIRKETQVQRYPYTHPAVCCAQFPASGEGMMYCTVATMCVTQL